MIQPECDLSLNILILGAEIIDILKKSDESIVVEKIMKNFLVKDIRRTHQQFFDTLTYLFIIGCISEKDYKITLNTKRSVQKTLL
jgi:hypothetical protein